MDKVERIAFDITGAFETHNKPGGINNYDKGIVSATRFQFTLESGSLWKYIQMLNEYHKLTTKREMLLYDWYKNYAGTPDVIHLKGDEAFIMLLKQECSTPEGQMIADLMAHGLYYQPMLNFTVNPRGWQLPLTLAFAYDTANQHGLGHSFFYEAEEKLAIPHKSKYNPANHYEQERNVVRAAAYLRADNLRKLAASDPHNLGGVTRRSEFWTAIFIKGDNFDTDVWTDWHFEKDLMVNGMLIKGL